MMFNPFDLINKQDIKKRIKKLKKKKSNLSNEELCHILIKKKSRLCAAAGGITAMPGIVPGIGTLVAVVGGMLADMSAMAFLLTELILEVAAVYDRDLDEAGTSKEAVWVLVASAGAGAAGKGLTNFAINQLTGNALKTLIEKALMSLGVRASQRTFFRILPLIGMFIAGWVNYYTCQKVGNFVAEYYAENDYLDNWDGQTLDVKAEVKGE
jgi:hypothetical protein